MLAEEQGQGAKTRRSARLENKEKMMSSAASNAKVDDKEFVLPGSSARSKNYSDERVVDSIELHEKGQEKSSKIQSKKSNGRTKIIPTPLFKYVIIPICNKILPYIPSTCSPNIITCMAMLCGILSYFFSTWDNRYRPDGCQLYSMLSMILWMAYGILDNLDGQHARRHKMVSRRGEYLDHACDSYLSGMVPMIAINALKSIPYSNSVRLFYIFLGGWFPFYLANWAQPAVGHVVMNMNFAATQAWMTVDELNMIILPGFIMVRTFASFFIEMKVSPLTSQLVDMLKLRGLDNWMASPYSEPIIQQWKMASYYFSRIAQTLYPDNVQIMDDNSFVWIGSPYTIGDALMDGLIFFCLFWVLRAMIHLAARTNLLSLFPALALLLTHIIYPPANELLVCFSVTILISEDTMNRLDGKNNTGINNLKPVIEYLIFNMVFYCGITYFNIIEQQYGKLNLPYSWSYPTIIITNIAAKRIYSNFNRIKE